MPITSLNFVQIDLSDYQAELISRTNQNIARLNQRLSETTNPDEQARLTSLIDVQNSYLSSLNAGLITSQANTVHASIVDLEISPNQTSPSPLLEQAETGFSGGVAPSPGIWLGTNLITTEYQNGDPIPLITDPAEWVATTGGACCYYNNDPENFQYGLLYNFYAITDPRGLAPSGWRISTTQDWSEFINYYSPSSADKSRETGTYHWVSGPTSTTNESGMSILPGGFRDISGNFQGLGSEAYFWQEDLAFGTVTGKLVDTTANIKTASSVANKANCGCSIRIVKV